MTARPSQITEKHLRRRALIYLRQSSPTQVRQNVGSAALQRDLRITLGQWGWPPDLIQERDEDLGITGSVAGFRHGFDELLADIRSDTASLVAAINISRLFRNLFDYIQFVGAARKYDVLLYQDGQIVDFRDPTSAFMASILASNAERENRVRADFARHARRKKAEAGLATNLPPIGYVTTTPGMWDKHPDHRVREVIQLIFDKFPERGSVRRLVRWMRHHAIQMPRRGTRDQLRWVPVTASHIFVLLHNPAYAGTYVHGRTTVDPSGEVDVRGHTRRLRQPATEWITVANHHPAYVTPERWAAIQAQLANNRVRRISPLGRGEALLQGLLRCSRHGRVFHSLYGYRARSADGTVVRVATYVCRPYQEHGDNQVCGAIRAARVDELVEAELLATLAPPSVALLDEMAREDLRQHDAIARARQEQLHRADHAVAEAERAFDHAGSDQTYLKQRLAERLNDALARRAAVVEEDARHPLISPRGLDKTELEELRRLSANVPACWRHPGVSPEQRKLIARAAITAVHATSGPDVWQFEIEWVGGARTRLEFATGAHIQKEIRELYNMGRTDAEIVEALQARGYVQQKGLKAGQPYDESALRCHIKYTQQLQRPFDEAAQDLINTRAAAGVNRESIADELNARGIRHRAGRWTPADVEAFLTRVAKRVDSLGISERVRRGTRRARPEASESQPPV